MAENWESMLYFHQENHISLDPMETQKQESLELQEIVHPQPFETDPSDSLKSSKSDPKRGKQFWTSEQNFHLQKLHGQMGNKWCAISKLFEHKTQNDVKNHFFSQLRMALRHLNKIIGKVAGFKMKPIKSGIIYKVISTCDQQYKKDTKSDRFLIDLAIRIKEGLFEFLETNQEKTELAVDIAGCIRNSKGKKSRELNRELLNQEQSEGQKNQNFSISKIFEEEAEFNEESFIGLDSKSKEEINNQILKENESSQIMLESSELIVRPQICLLNPFERIKIYCQEEEIGSTLLKEDEGYYTPFYLWEESRPFGS